MVRILVAEDNDGLRRLLGIHLRRAGYEVTEASDGAEALAALEREPVDLLIADVMMPGVDGFQLTESLRSSGYTLPVIIVTAKEALEDKRTGFRSGADDYMVKPINIEELLLRVRALLRRCRIAGESLLTVGETTLDESSLSVSRGNTTIMLRQKEFQLLHKLLSYPGKIFTRQSLMDDIWGYDSETDPRTVDVHIKRLREKLLPFPDFELQTVRGLGYKAVITE